MNKYKHSKKAQKSQNMENFVEMNQRQKFEA